MEKYQRKRVEYSINKYEVLAFILFFSAFSVFAMANKQSLILQGNVSEQMSVESPVMEEDGASFMLTPHSDHPYNVYVRENGKKRRIEPQSVKKRGRGPASTNPKKRYRFNKSKSKKKSIIIEAI